MMVVFALVSGLSLAAFVVAALAVRANQRRRAIVALILSLVGGVTALAVRPGRQPPSRSHAARILDHVPARLEPQFGYVGSEACRDCHPRQHDSWHDSYHRTMTQPATPETVLAPFDDVVLRRFGWPYRLERKGDEFWIDMVDPDWEREESAGSHVRSASPPRVSKPIVMITGSHHKQAFWVTSSRGQFLCRVPWSYRIDDQRWIPLEADYLSPPDSGAAFGIWNDNCIQCHSVAGQPRKTDETHFASRVAELGIACEACHGPGGAHVEFRNARGATSASDDHRSTADASTAEAAENDPIVDPRDLTHQRSAQVCGQCHITSVVTDHPQFLEKGFPYRPGADLEQTMFVLRYTDRPSEPWLKELLRRDPTLLQDRFWKDGTVRVTGREYNGLVESACHQRGTLSCLSCHSMHQYTDRSDQLARGMESNLACAACHEQQARDLTGHTHHPAGSSGSLCYNCHMPHTTYGLFKAVRSHRIDSPNITSSLRTGRPNACNLCHLDQTPAWVAEKLNEWYGHPKPALTPEQREVAGSLIWLLKGDAAQRAIVAWHVGWREAREVSGDEWLAPHLAVLLEDPYAAVRHVAAKSLAELPDFGDLKYDFLAEPDALREASRAAIAKWHQRHGNDESERTADPRLLGPAGRQRAQQLLRRRNDDPVFINE